MSTVPRMGIYFFPSIPLCHVRNSRKGTINLTYKEGEEMANSGMLHKFFLLTLVFGSALAADDHPRLRLQLRHGLKTSRLSGDQLVRTACQDLKPDESQCSSILREAAPHHKANATSLAFFTFRFVEDRAVNVANGVKKVAAVPNLPPLLQVALSDCMEQYNSLDDLIEDAVNAVRADSTSDAQQFTQAAIANIDVCDSQLEANIAEENAENKGGQELQWSNDLDASNLLLKNMLTAALNLLKAS